MNETEVVNPEVPVEPKTDGQPAEGQPAEGQVAEGEKKPRKRGGNRNPRAPKLKDWIRAIKSQGTGLDNVNITLIVNEANGYCELITQSPKQEGSEELEAPRTQVFRVNSYQVINDPTRDPVAKAEAEKAAEPAAEPAAPTA